MASQIELVKAGFVKDKFYSEYEKLKENNFVDLDEDTAKKMADEEIYEDTNGYKGATGYPNSVKRYRIVYESFSMSIEEMYYWFLNQLKQDMAFPEAEKIVDTFTPAEGSAQWGNIQQRLTIQQDKVQQNLATIGRMLKESIFPLVRELRIIDERLKSYRVWQESHSADVSLKGLYIDMAEGGSKNPSSVYGLAQNVGFTILPDLFFNTHVKDLKDLDTKVDKLEYNKQIKNILKRKLHQYLNWVTSTHKELENRYKFTLQILRQDWASIKTYISWVKPFLRNIKRLSTSKEHADSAELIAGFETSLAELEFIVKKKGKGKYMQVIMATFDYRTMPQLSYQAEGYNRGPIHLGRVDFKLRGYAWTKEQIKNYKIMREKENFELIGNHLDNTMQEAMEALGGDLERFLEEAGEKLEKKSEKEDKKEEKKDIPYTTAFEPFVELFKGIFEIFIPKVNIKGKKIARNARKEAEENKANLKGTMSGVQSPLWQAYKNYKKSHRLVAW